MLRPNLHCKKAVSNDATAVAAEQALEMLTINGAKALGIDDKCGSIEKGKCADIAAFDLSGLAYQPIYNPISQLIYTNTSHNCSHIWVNGKCLLNEGKLTTLNTTEIIQRANNWKQKILS